MNGDVGAPQRQLRVPMEVERLNKLTHALEEVVTRLSDRLGPVLAPPRAEISTANDNPPPPRGLTPLVEQLSDLALSVDSATQRINNLCDRLEV